MAMRVAFIGLGVMGYPMAGHLFRAGHDVTVFNRTADKARQWLAADLDQWKSVAAGGTQAHTVARQALQHWRVDPDLAGLRDADAIAKLSSDERDECDVLWSDVDGLLDQMRELATTAPAHQ